jgi:DeoR family transcriptional regulator, aga operon transcriptional repressor
LVIMSGMPNLDRIAARRPAQKVQDRREAILNHLSGGQMLAIEQLIAALGISPATVRRDLRHLARERLVRREHGLVALAEPFAFAPFMEDPGFRQQVHQMAKEKRRIATAAASLIQDGQTIALAAGTTTAQISCLLGTKRDLTVVTNAVNVAMEIAYRKGFIVHLTGGYLSGDWFAMVGPRALDFIRTMFVDSFFFGANGVHPEHGITDRHVEEAAINRALAAQAKRRFLLADHTKLGQVAKCLVCGIEQIDTIITDSEADAVIVQALRHAGVEVLCV